MKIGDGVRTRDSARLCVGDEIGLIVDTLEMDDGFTEYEVTFADDRGWFSDLELEVILDHEKAGWVADTSHIGA